MNNKSNKKSAREVALADIDEDCRNNNSYNYVRLSKKERKHISDFLKGIE